MSKHLPRRWRDQLAAWLPALVMAPFALGTFWLVRSTPSPQPFEAARAATHEPDYFMREFSVRKFDPQGRMSAELRGPHGEHFPDTGTLEVTQPRLRSFDAEGKLTVGSADRGVSNADGSRVRFYGNVQVVREEISRPGGGVLPRSELRGEYLLVFVNDERVSSSEPVDLIRGGDHFTGDRFEYDNKTGVGRLEGRVRGVLWPASKPGYAG
ncbi:MAG: LPS export ABC transporter periplasmic protein LptC [Burkholderiaceae bacterium]|jgi:lipopolysaccharide export system protein LptC|nr:LPS export ABC transporter periplasmic protein LptC [Burkholderiaceae bacterium]